MRRSTHFSPYTVGRVDTRKWMFSPLIFRARWPSWATMRLAMSMPLMILMREMMYMLSRGGGVRMV